MKFFSPTSELKELLLLQHIEEKPDTTQKQIAQVISGAPSMVNVYIDNLEKKGFMERDYKTPKTVHYNISSEGVKRKNYLSISYFQELLDLYHLAEQNIEGFLDKLEKKGYKNILFYGAGEVAETILGIINERSDKPLRVLGLIDDNEDIKDKDLLGYQIISRDQIGKYIHDGIVITSYTFEDDIKKRLEEIDYPKDKVELFFSGI